MITSLVKGTIVGGLVAFALNAVSWMVLPYHELTLSHLKDEDAVRKALSASAEKGGVYLLPCPEAPGPGATAEQKKAARDAAMQRATLGPNALIAYSPNGADPQMKLPMLRGLLIQMAGAFLFSLLILFAPGAGYIKKVILVTLAAAAGGVLGQLPYWNWFYFSKEFAVLQVLDLTATWFLTATVLAALVPGKSK